MLHASPPCAVIHHVGAAMTAQRNLPYLDSPGLPSPGSQRTVCIQWEAWKGVQAGSVLSVSTERRAEPETLGACGGCKAGEGREGEWQGRTPKGMKYFPSKQAGSKKGKWIL